jgi:anti-sigma regulatory factor (Ser/Thr protein kinase)/HAMP domain-containing protein
MLLIFLSLLPASALMIYTATEQRQMAVAAVRENARSLIRPTSAHYERMVEGTRQLLSVLARLPEVRKRNAEACRDLFISLRAEDPLYANIGEILADGKLLASAIVAPGSHRLNDRSYFQRVLRSGRFASGDYQIGRAVKKPTINFGYPVRDDSGKLVAVVFAALDLDWLSHLAQQADLPDGSTLTLMDRAGTVLVHYPGLKDWMGKPLPDAVLLKKIVSNGSGFYETVEPDGVRRLYAFSRIGGLGSGARAYLSIGVPKNLAFADANALLLRNLIVLWLIGLLTLCLAWVGGDWFILSRIQTLLRTTKRLSAGDLSARTGLERGNDEVGELAGAFDRMAGSLESAQQQVARAEEEKKRFYREVIRAVTHDKFHLVDDEEIPLTGTLLVDVPLEETSDYRAMRNCVREVSEKVGMSKENSGDFVLAVGEASANALKHAMEGRCQIYLNGERIVARITDRGAGIKPDDLPATILKPGFSTKISLGMGYTLMLELVDTVWLSTGPGGTVVQLEKWLHPENHPEPLMLPSWEKF